MKFGIFYEHQIPRPWTADSEYNLLHQSLEQIESADALGYDHAMEAEHQAWKQSVLSGEIELEEIDPKTLTPVSLQSTRWSQEQQTSEAATSGEDVAG